jgi:hypothetical protein
MATVASHGRYTITCELPTLAAGSGQFFFFQILPSHSFYARIFSSVLALVP